MRIADSRYGISSALTTNPARSCESMHFLPSVSSANARTSLDGLGLGHDRRHELDQRQHRHRVEEVHAEHAPRVLGLGAELHDRHRRRVGRQELRVGQQLVEPPEDVALELLVLDDGLDRRVDALDVLERRRHREPVQAPRPCPPRTACRSARRAPASGRSPPASAPRAPRPPRPPSRPRPSARTPPRCPNPSGRHRSHQLAWRSNLACSRPRAARGRKRYAASAGGTGMTQTQFGSRCDPGRTIRPAPRSAAACRATSAASLRSSSCCATGVSSPARRYRRRRTCSCPVSSAARTTSCWSNHHTFTTSYRDIRGPSSRGGASPRGKSGHRRARWSVTPTRGNPRESATEITPPKAARKGGPARLKWCGKSAPAPR